MVHDSFANIAEKLRELNVDSVDGVLLDLGVSSPQLDTPERGFSFRFNAPLDMRMDNSRGISAAEWLSRADETQIADVLWRYGEEKFSRRIAKAIVTERVHSALATTDDLASLVGRVITFREKGQHPATRTFQAIRIQVNNELGDLETFLQSAPKLLKENGRIVIISFHSLEDRIVKTQFADLSTADKLPKWVMVSETTSDYKVIAKKVKASALEVAENSRSRSAVLRCLERVSVKNN
jgi:16S rRNA (cytosine1402-N4)-methyltransferase